MAPGIKLGNEIHTKLFQYISSNDINGLKTILGQHKVSPEIFDDDGITPLQHAAYKGSKEIAQMLLDQGANAQSGRHEHGYTALHFAALSGNCELCLLLLSAGAKGSALNSVGRTPSQMAAFVGNHHCVAVINNFIPKSEVDYYTVPQGLEKEPKLMPVLAAPLHRLIMQVNVHPIRVAMNLQPTLITQMPNLRKVLELMSTKLMRGTDTNEVMSFKVHYLAYVMGELQKCRQPEKSTDPVELFAKKILRTGRGEEYLERFIRECIREFPYRECSIFRQMVKSLAHGSSELSPAVSVVIWAINGQRGFADNEANTCSTCGEDKVKKKCSKCKKVQYCDRECQRLHWFAHKKECKRPITTQVEQSTSNNSSSSSSNNNSNNNVSNKGNDNDKDSNGTDNNNDDDDNDNGGDEDKKNK